MLTLIYLLSLPAATFASELPVLKIPTEWSRCTAVSDCMVAGDACRSCGGLILINKKFKDDFLREDERARKKNGFSRACEACSNAELKLSCKNKVCGIEN